MSYWAVRFQKKEICKLRLLLMSQSRSKSFVSKHENLFKKQEELGKDQEDAN